MVAAVISPDGRPGSFWCFRPPEARLHIHNLASAPQPGAAADRLLLVAVEAERLLGTVVRELAWGIWTVG
jgi:hypothetical protein